MPRDHERTQYLGGFSRIVIISYVQRNFSNPYLRPKCERFTYLLIFLGPLLIGKDTLYINVTDTEGPF